MNPEVWGKHGWHFLHSITLAYPDNPTNLDKQKYKYFFESLSDVIPCDKCKSHYKYQIQHYPPNLESKYELVNWLIFIHNNVNVINNKPKWTYEQFINYYKDLYSKDKSSNISYVFIILIIIAIIYFYQKKN